MSTRVGAVADAGIGSNEPGSGAGAGCDAIGASASFAVGGSTGVRTSSRRFLPRGAELQGIKRGIMELADVVLVHKADGDLAAAADRAAQQCMLAMRVLHSGAAEAPPVLVASSVTGRGLDDAWRTIEHRAAAARSSGAFAARRARQAGDWLDELVRERLLATFLADPAVATAMTAARDDVAHGRRLPAAVARELLAMRPRA
jgi:LAO/AO transport system kinase